MLLDSGQFSDLDVLHSLIDVIELHVKVSGKAVNAICQPLFNAIDFLLQLIESSIN